MSGPAGNDHALVTENLTVHYGPIQALHGISLQVPLGKIVVLIGANGAGKSSTLAAVAGSIRPSGGRVLFHGEDVTYESAPRKVARGIVLVPEGRRIFANLTVRENLELGGYLQRSAARMREQLEYVHGLFPRLAERSRQLAGTLSGGEQQMLAMGRALMSEATVLLLDEPSLGLAPNLVTEIFARIQELNRRGLTILLVEQNAHKSLALADWAYVIETGRVVAEGTGRELQADDKVQEAYLGL